jgi:uncharacterized protein YbbC (DUF1343 family)
LFDAILPQFPVSEVQSGKFIISSSCNRLVGGVQVHIKYDDDQVTRTVYSYSDLLDVIKDEYSLEEEQYTIKTQDNSSVRREKDFVEIRSGTFLQVTKKTEQVQMVPAVNKQ